MATEANETRPATEGASGSRTRALVLWVLVAIALLYGVVATAMKIPALFA